MCVANRELSVASHCVHARVESLGGLLAQWMAYFTAIVGLLRADRPLIPMPGASASGGVGGPIASLYIYTFPLWNFSPNSSITLGKLPFTPNYSGFIGRIQQGRDYSGDSTVCGLRLPGLRPAGLLGCGSGCYPMCSRVA